MARNGDGRVFPARATTGDVRSITPNGTVNASGGEAQNGFYPQGTLGTGSTSGPLWPQKRKGNRTGERTPSW